MSLRMSFFNSIAIKSQSRFWRVAGLCAVLKLLQTLSTAVSVVPRLRLFEATICRAYYQTHDPGAIGIDNNVPEELCKIDAVQTDLAQLTGWNSFFFYIPMLLLAIPYSALSERVSRKTVLLVNVSSGILSQLYVLMICYFYNTFDVRLIWLASLFDCVGGGRLVFNTMTQVLIAEVTAPSSLSTVYFRLTSIMSVSRVMGVTSGSYLLSYGVWLPIWLGLAVYGLCVPVLLLLSDHRNHISAKTNPSDTENHLLQPGHHSTDPDSAEKKSESDHKTQNIKSSEDNQSPTQSTSLLRSFSAYLTFMSDHFLILAIFFIHESGMGVRNITEQWMSQRFTWPLRMTGYILASETFLGSLFLAILPTISHHLLRGSKNTRGARQVQKAQLYIIRGSLFAAASGTALIAASGSSRLTFLMALGVFALAVGFHDALKSYVTGLVDVKAITRMYMCISIVETCANIVNGPVWAEIYTIGMSYGGRGMPLPFLVCCLLFLGSLGLVSRLV
ncbi:major facilitator superfamily domain-containing protein [Talaromyces proteolyticus]|uniref:Major facilitator superfamily domain-containing protein n=1 Tax=Talaromyces proteolyticus TaxID=1131652 RepID=A0AAD4PS18_9EURO|nr:major facilitator superfamily domain-containing protein [Talaromyces proteolyticus]KAH8690235.1 major facilitator superfamily domain-containing protein [Talaromyces proteolyticus]